MRETSKAFGWLQLGVLLIGGCGASGPVEHDVSGSVTWNGEDLPAGDIIFTPADGQGVPHAGKIVAGKYRLRTTAGRHQVAVFATREFGPADPEMGARPREMYLPARYNHETTLTAEVTAGGENQFDFVLRAEE
jgi:hypothetical protein